MNVVSITLAVDVQLSRTDVLVILLTATDVGAFGAENVKLHQEHTNQLLLHFEKFVKTDNPQVWMMAGNAALKSTSTVIV
jgi:hypothetical protein